MKRFLPIPFLLLLIWGCSNDTTPATSSPDERYFGLHFDFHAVSRPYYEEHPIGSTLREDDIREICRNMRPDFLQIDCKGHPGWASYPSGCGNAIPWIQGDPLKTWRRVTAEEGVGLYMHYSGVYDCNYISSHPEEGVVRADLTRSLQATRTGGGYVDELLIPQLKELAGDYGVDGVWVDGDCWEAFADFDPATVAAFQDETGIDLNGKLPTRRGMPYYNEYRDYCRDLFRRYLNHYVDAVHSEYPSFKIASNWAFSDHMPEKVCADVDFISGDLAPQDSYWWARFSGRSMEKQGVPWDLMAWGFRSVQKRHVYKTAPQIIQEASAVIALGGGFQVYICQFPDGSPRMDRIRALYPLSEFMHERREWCFQGHMEPQVAVLLSTYDRYREADELFSRNGCDKAMSMVNLLCDAGHSVSVVSEHDLADGGVGSYPVIVVPELYEGLEQSTLDMLEGYVRDGGSLILNGPNTSSLFAGKGFPEGETVDVFGEDGPVLSVREFGCGKVAVISTDVAGLYYQYTLSNISDLMDSVLVRMYEPRIRIEGCKGLLEIVDLWKDDRMLVQLVNANGLHHSSNSLIEKSIAPVADISLKIRTDKRPSVVRLQPAGTDLDFSWDDGYAYVNVPRLDYHSVIVIN
ncbi:MAG: hypothetical protein MJY50_04435 [Bacteroidales bacterium]|nr:hypothetical protein [Bacteroidales bacterium]